MGAMIARQSLFTLHGILPPRPWYSWFMPRTITTAEWLARSEASLRAAGIGTARLDCLVLLEDCLGTDRASLLAHPETTPSVEQLNILDEHISRRVKHEPLAYIRGKTEFYGRDFTVNRDVLEPRPESETMIDLLKKLIQSDKKAGLRLADVGSGSGCLGITAAIELGLRKADFYDIDPATLKVAKINARKLGVSGNFYESDLLSKEHGSYDVILANLPYVPDGFHINEAAMNEPRIAIYGGSDGLELYRRLFEQLEVFGWQPRYILTESLPPQHGQLKTIAEFHSFKLSTSEDFIQVFEPAA